MLFTISRGRFCWFSPISSCIMIDTFAWYLPYPTIHDAPSVGLSQVPGCVGIYICCDPWGPENRIETHERYRYEDNILRIEDLPVIWNALIMLHLKARYSWTCHHRGRYEDYITSVVSIRKITETNLKIGCVCLYQRVRMPDVQKWFKYKKWVEITMPLWPTQSVSLTTHLFLLTVRPDTKYIICQRRRPLRGKVII